MRSILTLSWRANQWTGVYMITASVMMELNGTKSSRMDYIKFVEDSIWKIWRDMVCLRRPYRFKFFKCFLPQVLLGPFLSTLSQIFCWPAWFKWAKLVKKNHEQNKASPSSKNLLFKNIQTKQRRIKILLKQFFVMKSLFPFDLPFLKYII